MIRMCLDLHIGYIKRSDGQGNLVSKFWSVLTFFSILLPLNMGFELEWT